MTTMLEKMAEAISEESYRAACYSPGSGVSLDEARDVARAALQAIREPSKAMIMAGTDVSRAAYEAYCGEAGSNDIFTAMIDAILEGKA